MVFINARMILRQNNVIFIQICYEFILLSYTMIIIWNQLNPNFLSLSLPIFLLCLHRRKNDSFWRSKEIFVKLCCQTNYVDRFLSIVCKFGSPMTLVFCLFVNNGLHVEYFVVNIYPTLPFKIRRPWLSLHLIFFHSSNQCMTVLRQASEILLQIAGSIFDSLETCEGLKSCQVG